MPVFIQANAQQEKEIRSSIAISGDEVVFSRRLPGEQEYKGYRSFLILDEPASQLDFSPFARKPVYVNEVVHTLEEMNAPENIGRINGWPGFLKRALWEVVSKNEKNTPSMLSILNRKVIFVKDVPGFVAARTVSMIINEAYYALREGVSTREEIDLAMKLGTNYPYGPFEWADKIGLQNIYNLLIKLAETNSLYEPAFPNPDT